MPVATRSKTRGNPVDAPRKPSKRASAAESRKFQKDSETARNHGTHLLRTLQDEEERELRDALGATSHSGHGNGRRDGRGRNRSHSHGGGYVGSTPSGDESETPAADDTVFTMASETDDLDGRHSGAVQATLDDTQMDASDEVGIGSTGDGPNPQLDNTRSELRLNGAHSDNAAIDREGTDDEYESWGGFGSTTPVNKIAQNRVKNARKSLKDKIAAKTGGKNPSAGKKSGKRKAPNVVDKPRKCTASGIEHTASDNPTTDLDEVVLQQGGFVEEDDRHTIAADREEMVNPKKTGRRSSTAMVSVVHSTKPSKQKVVEARKIGSIPPPYKERFDTDFVRSVIKWISQSEEPWNNPDGKVPLQGIHDTVYPTVDGIVDRKHPLVEPLKSKLGAWRVAIKKKAQKLVDNHLEQRVNISPASSVHQYIGWLKPNAKDNGSQDAPFMFSNGLEYNAAQLEGKYLNPLLLETFAAHFTSSGVNDDPMHYLKPPPIGAFALAICAVERALGRWEYGRPEDTSEFSRNNWEVSTHEYARGLKKISDARWKKILSGTQEFTPYKRRETTVTVSEENENYRTRAPDSDVEI